MHFFYTVLKITEFCYFSFFKCNWKHSWWLFCVIISQLLPTFAFAWFSLLLMTRWPHLCELVSPANYGCHMLCSRPVQLWCTAAPKAPGAIARMNSDTFPTVNRRVIGILRGDRVSRSHISRPDDAGGWLQQPPFEFLLLCLFQYSNYIVSSKPLKWLHHQVVQPAQGLRSKTTQRESFLKKEFF